MGEGHRGEVAVFEQLFEVLPDGEVTPKVWVRIGDTDFGPGAHFGPNYRPHGLPIGEWPKARIWGHRERHGEHEVFVIERPSIP